MHLRGTEYVAMIRGTCGTTRTKSDLGDTDEIEDLETEEDKKIIMFIDSQPVAVIIIVLIITNLLETLELCNSS
jgi:hypothetical protein